MSRRFRLVCFVVCWVAAVAAAPRARAATDAQTKEAGERFHRGLRLYNEGDDAGAAIEFRQVFDLVGRVEALYNLGLALADLGRAVEAVDTLDRVIANPGTLTGKALENARQVRAQQALRVGALLIETNTPARIDVDNVPIGRTPLPAPVRLTAGARLVTAVAPGHAPASQRVELAGGARANLRLELVPMAGALAQLRVRSALPGADIVVDGQVLGRTPLPASLPVTPGRHELRLRRAGFAETRREISLEEGALGELDLDADEAPQSGAWGRVRLALSEPDADVMVNGRRRSDVRAGLRLPEGPHRLEVHRAGFFPLERDIVVAADREVTVPVTLDPTEETRAAQRERASAQRLRGWVTLAAGAVVAGGGLVFHLSNQRELRGARAEFDEVAAMLRPGGQCFVDFDQAACSARTSHANDRLSRAESWRWVGPTVAGVGLAAAITGAVLRLLAEDPRKYDAGRVDLAKARPVVSFSLQGGTAGVALAF